MDLVFNNIETHPQNVIVYVLALWNTVQYKNAYMMGEAYLHSLLIERSCAKKCHPNGPRKRLYLELSKNYFIHIKHQMMKYPLVK